MSFFIRKKSKNFTNFTKPAGESGGSGGNRPKNKDYKPRPTKKPLGKCC